MRAVIYIRVSTEEQLEGHSLDAQRTTTRALLTDRQWDFAGEYLDAGISAKSDSYRPALAQLLEDAGRGRFDVVVVDKIDRFYRHLKGLLMALDTLQECNVTFVSVQEKIDLSTPWGKLTMTVLGMLAEIYIDNLRYETRKGKMARARKGLWNGSIPLGYCDGLCSACTDGNGANYCPQYGEADRGDGRKLVIHPVEGEAVRRMFAWYVTGEYTDGEIAERLNADGLDLPDGRRIGFRSKGHPPRVPPTVFSKDTARELLQHEFYSGVVAYFGVDEKGQKRKRKNPLEVFPGEHPALVSAADFARAQELRKMFAHRVRLGRTYPRMYPLSGLILCDTCGRNMRAITSGGRSYYRDVTHANHIGNCVQKTVRAEVAEQQVADLLCAVKLPTDWPEWVMNSHFTPQERATLAEAEQALQARLDRATELYLGGTISKEKYQAEKWQHQVDKAGLHPAALDAIMAAGHTLEGFAQRWAAAQTPLEKNELLRLVLAGARIKEHSLTALVVKLAFYPLMRHWRSGDDGARTRDLRLDRPTC